MSSYTRMGFPYAYRPAPYAYRAPICRMGQRSITCIIYQNNLLNIQNNLLNILELRLEQLNSTPIAIALLQLYGGVYFTERSGTERNKSCGTPEV